MREILREDVPGEPASTCDACAMAPRCDNDPGRTFRPDLKCCGYTPTTPNFQVGAVLQGRTHPHGLASMTRRIEAGEGVTPLGVLPPSAYAEQWQDTPYGSDPALRCVHFVEDGGLCGVWQHREAVCSTWYCQLDRGVVAHRFWMSLRRFLICATDGLVRHAAREVGAVETEERWDWGPWKQRVPAYYQACWEVVAPLAWSDVRELGGFELTLRAGEVRETHQARMQPELPERVRRGTYRRAPLSQGGVRLWGWGAWASIDVSAEELGVIEALDGQTTASLLASGRVERARLQEWVDQRVIVDAG